MCLLLFAYNVIPDCRLLVAANRDEFHVRPTRALDFWDDSPQILAGRDLEAGGTWLGLSTHGKFAGLTNYRDPARIICGAPSRGALIQDFLTNDMPAEQYIHQRRAQGPAFNGFNLVLMDDAGLWYWSNISDDVRRLEPGFHGLSNHLLNTPWPKVKKGLAALRRLFEHTPEASAESVFNLLADREKAPDDCLPDTGVGIQWERLLSALFISSAVYGTRCSSVIRIGHDNNAVFTERSFTAGEDADRHHTEKSFSLSFRKA